MPTAAERAVAVTLGEMATRAQYEVLRSGRQKLAKSAPLWRRVTDGKPCGFCAMVASRGPVYTSESAAGADGNRYHARCGCTAEPYFGDPNDWEPSPEERRFLEAYRESYETGIPTDELADRIEAWLANPSGGLPRIPDDGRVLPVKVLNTDDYQPWDLDGVAFPWQHTDDLDSRLTEMWAPSMEGQSTLAKMVRNRAAGLDEMTDVVIPEKLYQWHTLSTLDGVALYTREDVTNDIRNAAATLARRLNDSKELVPEMYRGMRVADATSLYRVGDVVDADVVSFTTRKKTAEMYAEMVDEKEGRLADFEPVLIRVVNSEGYKLKTHTGMGWNGDQGEMIVRGRLRITGQTTEDGVVIFDGVIE